MAFNQMAEDVERHQRAAVEQERIRRELELGRQIQHDMLPHDAAAVGPDRDQGRVGAGARSRRRLLQLLRAASGHIAMLVGDVSGKGVGAALLMANIQASLRTRLRSARIWPPSPTRHRSRHRGELARARLRDAVCRDSRSGHAPLRYVNAGHIIRSTCSAPVAGLERMSSTGLPVGLLAGHGYSEQRMQLAPATCSSSTPTAASKPRTRRARCSAPSAWKRCSSSVAATVRRRSTGPRRDGRQAFRGTREPFDDATMMAVKVG